MGFLRNFKTSKKSTDYYLKVKTHAFNETLKNMPYFELDENNNLISSTYTCKSMHSMLYLGWGVRYTLPLKSEKLSIRGDLGFNLLLPSRYASTYSNGNPKGIQYYRRPNNYFFTRPEASIGIGYKVNIGNHELTFTPLYSYNFTIKYLNLVPSFHTIGIETTLNL